MDDIEFSKEIRAAIKADDLEKVVSLIKSDTHRLNMLTPFGTWLHVAANVGNLEIFKRLVEMGADINKPGGTFETGPLKTAASCGHIEIVQYLLSQGAEMDVAEPFQNPLFGAIHNGHLTIVQLLVDYGFDPRLKYTGKIMKGTDAISYAREHGQLKIAEYLESR